MTCRQIDASFSRGQRGQFGNLYGAVPKIRAQSADNPYRARARQPAEKLNEQLPVFDTDGRRREQFLQLIDDEDQLGFFESQETTRPGRLRANGPAHSRTDILARSRRRANEP